jgi:hypothetical protein
MDSQPHSAAIFSSVAGVGALAVVFGAVVALVAGFDAVEFAAFCVGGVVVCAATGVARNARERSA